MMTWIDDAYIPKTPTATEAADSYEGVVVTPPLSDDDTCGVHLHHFRDVVGERKWEFECSWLPRGIDRPEEGDLVLVTFSEERDPWIIGWKPVTPMPEIATQIPLNAGGGWVNHADTTNFSPATFKKDVSRQVALQGLVKNTGTPAAGSVIGTLPLGYRPTKTLVFTQAFRVDGTAAYGLARIDVNPSGQIIATDAIVGSTPWTAQTWFTLSGIIFRTEDS